MPRSKQSVKILLVDSELPNKRQTRSQTKELISAFENLDIEHADKLIFNKGINPSVINPKLLMRTLYHAVKMKNTSLVRELLKYNPQLATIDEEPLLMVAIDQCSMEIAMMLINAGADLEILDCHNRSVLYYAVKKEAFDIVEELLRRGVRIHEEEYGTILAMASMSSKAAEILVLLSQYNYINSEMRETLSLKAIFKFIECESDNATAVEKLWDLGVPIDQTDCQGITALHYAVSKAKIKKVELLLSHGADVNKKTHRGSTPIMLAVSLQEPIIAALLIDRGANIHDCDSFGRYPIHIACNSGSMRNIQLLIRLGAKVDVLDQLDFTPFSLLLRNSFTEQINIFLKHFAFLTVNGISISNADLATIQNNQDMLRIYNECWDELRRMKGIEFKNGVTYYDLIGGNIENLSILGKNAGFVTQFRKDQRNIKGKKLGLLKYSKELDIAFQMTKKRRNLYIAKETMLQNTFKGVLPKIVLDKIARYLLLDDLNSFKKEFYLSLFSDENGK